ncbi:MAG: hypothetical protein KBC64_05475 [Simkaniaceae bacterium]|nr:hypothetical protein [Simkaniaceae bacterium]
MELSEITTKYKIDIRCETPEIDHLARPIFEVIYSDQAEKLFGSGKEACQLILQTFTHIGVSIRIGALNETTTLGRYTPLTRTIELESSLLLEGKTPDFIATTLHEMTHALHYHFFSTAASLDDEFCTKELGCKVSDYRTALIEASTKIPTLCLTHQMRDDYFLPPLRLVQEENYLLAYNEYLARIPEMYYRFRETHSREEIKASLEEIFPMGLSFFWGKFKDRCEGKEDIPPEFLDFDVEILSLIAKLPKEFTASIASVQIIYDFLKNTSLYEGKIKACLDHGALLCGEELLISESLLYQFATLSQKSDPESEIKLEDLYRLIKNTRE